MTLGSSEAIKNSVAEGLGLSCLSRYVVQDLAAANRLSVLRTRLPRLTRRLTIIHNQRKLLSDSLRGFIAHCRHHVDAQNATAEHSPYELSRKVN